VVAAANAEGWGGKDLSSLISQGRPKKKKKAKKKKKKTNKKKKPHQKHHPQNFQKKKHTKKNKTPTRNGGPRRERLKRFWVPEGLLESRNWRMSFLTMDGKEKRSRRHLLQGGAAMASESESVAPSLL